MPTQLRSFVENGVSSPSSRARWLALGFLIAGQTVLISTYGIGSALSEAASGYMNLAAIGVWLSKNSRYPLAAVLTVVSNFTLQYPNLVAGNSLAWAGALISLIGSAPGFLESITQQPAARLFRDLKATESTPVNLIKRAFVAPFAKSRVSCSITNIVTIQPFMINAILQGHKPLVVALFLMLVGNIFGMFSKAARLPTCKITSDQLTGY